MKTLTIRNVPRQLADALDRERSRSGESLNQTVLDLLRRALGLGADAPPGNGLAALGGTWSADDFRDFETAAGPFEAIDDDMWA
ncbi:MAG: hypothetical protein AB7H88_05820 [Vicinamibacterales bacterium]